MKKHILICLLAVILGAQSVSAQPLRWSAELAGAKGFGNSPKLALGVQGNYYFVATELFRAGAGAGVSLSKPMSAILGNGEKQFGYTELSVPVYLRGEYVKPTQTNGNLVLRADVGYRIGVNTTYYQGLKAVTEDTGIRYWSGVFVEPQVGLLISERLFYSIGCCLQRGQYQQTTRTETVTPDSMSVQVVTEDKHAILPVITLHVELRF